MKRVTTYIGDAFGTVEQLLREEFIPSLFIELRKGNVGMGVTRLPMKQADLDLPDQAKTPPDNCKPSCVITGHLVADLNGQEEFSHVRNDPLMFAGCAVNGTMSKPVISKTTPFTNKIEAT